MFKPAKVILSSVVLVGSVFASTGTVFAHHGSYGHHGYYNSGYYNQSYNYTVPTYTVPTTNSAYDENVYIVQSKLTTLGYNAGTSDGIYGNKTKAALEEFQGDYGLTVTGRINQATVDTLLSYSAYDENVYLAQNRLIELGYEVTANGFYDKSTITALLNFQDELEVSTLNDTSTLLKVVEL